MHRLFVVVLAFAIGCSVIDSTDMDQLLKAIESLPPASLMALRKATATKIAIKWLNGRPENDRVLKTECRQQDSDGKWSPWVEAVRPLSTKPSVNSLDVLVYQFIEFMSRKEHFGYIEHKRFVDMWQTPGEADRREQITGKITECRTVWEPNYAPDEVPEKVSDPSKVTDGDIVENLLSAPVPPAGFAIPELAPLMPFLCPMDVNWSCPGDPLYPGGGDSQ